MEVFAIEPKISVLFLNVDRSLFRAEWPEEDEVQAKAREKDM